jgi:hypothetical protein
MYYIQFFSISVIGNLAAPTIDEIQELYVDTCQSSCSLVKDNEEEQDCRERFCPNYASYLLTGVTIPGSSPSLASSHRKEVAEFCATWMINLINEIGWKRRIHLNLKECICAAGKDCLVK